MAAAPLSSSAPDQRLLAAVVFTDVVGFSARMQKDETNTLKHLERDFITMREFCTLQGGTVIKTTGDGLLLCFTSAVQAVDWALRTQRHFAEHARTYSPEESLRHRVGIHLGDIFVKGDDVMGDGVNIAARVQTEAPTGGICISQVVYDVVKNKLKLDVVRLEHRKLKNISETIQIYQVLLEPPQRAAPAAVALPTSKKPEPVSDPASIIPRVVIIAFMLVAMGVAGVFLYRAHVKHEAELAQSRTVHAKLDAALQSAPSRHTPPGGEATATKASVVGAAAVPEFDFARMTRERPARESATAAEERAIQQATAGVQVLETYVDARLRRYTKDQPLLVPRTTRPQDFSVFTDSSGQLYFAEGGATRKRNWQELGAEVQSIIVLSILRSSPVAPPREVVQGAEAFAYLRGLPEMAGALIRERQATGRSPR